VTPELVLQHPELATYGDASLSTRVAIANKVIPEIAVEATQNAAREWGRPLSAVTHMVLATTSATSIPGIDLAIARSLNLAPTVQRICMYQTGCWGGGAVLRVGRLLAESARHARVLVVAVEANTVMNFRKPTEETLYKVSGFLAHATLGDGAAALILGCDPGVDERALFELHWSAQMAVPGSEAAIRANMSETGLVQHLQKDTVPVLIAQHLRELTSAGGALVGAPRHSDMFWVVHSGAWKILEVVAETLGLDAAQLQPSWDVLRAFGNCSSPTCLVVLDELRRQSQRLGAGTTGAGCEWGFLVGLGPGFNLEVSLLRSVPLPVGDDAAF
jgi:chalcone synthase